MPDIQYIEQYFKGCTVSYGNSTYRVQNDRGWLHIVVFENGKRKKISLDKILLFPYGSYQDWVFNGWWQTYPDYDQFREFCESEKCLNL